MTEEIACQECGNPFTPKLGGHFCSRPCLDKNRHRRNQVEVSCPLCGAVRVCRRTRAHKPCATCSRPDASGSNNGNWKGGHRHWSPGRFGRDKDGLSWKVQRRRAWERDNYTCQECGTKPKRNPDVHHIIPFRVSLSHALENLRCLCQKCHLREEAVVQEVWGGQLIVRDPAAPRPEKPSRVCPVCGTIQRKHLTWGCPECKRIQVLPLIREMLVAGYSKLEMGRRLNLPDTTIGYWLRRYGA